MSCEEIEMVGRMASAEVQHIEKELLGAELL